MKLTARQRRLIDRPRETEVPPFPVRKFTVAEFHQLLKVNILRSGDPYELLRGWIVPKPKASPRNASARSRLMLHLLKLFDESEWVVGTNHPITFRDSEPEPSSSVFRGPDDAYTRRHPRPPSVPPLRPRPPKTARRIARSSIHPSSAGSPTSTTSISSR